jgi:uncharacterized membrane protein YhaH (DUF805 family)
MSFRTWFSLKGRISRETWWVYYFFVPNGFIIAAWLIDALLPDKGSMFKPFGGGMGQLSVVSVSVILFTCLTSISGQVKRWHDLDRTGWWACLTMIPFFAGVGFFLILDVSMKGYFVALACFPLALAITMISHVTTFFGQLVLAGIGITSVLLYVLWVLHFFIGGNCRGTPGTNRFGPDPLSPKHVSDDTATADDAPVAFKESAVSNVLTPMTSHQPDQKKSERNRISLPQWFSPKGRISRKTWWIFYCIVPICLLILLGAAQQIIKLGVETPHKSSMGEYASIAVFYALGLVVLWIGFAGLTKRWHDQDKSGWGVILYFIPGILSTLFPFFISLMDLEGSGGLLHRWLGGVFVLTSLLPFLMITWACAVAGFQPGTPGPNRFGPDPLAPPTAVNIALPPQAQ